MPATQPDSQPTGAAARNAGAAPVSLLQGRSQQPVLSIAAVATAASIALLAPGLLLQQLPPELHLVWTPLLLPMLQRAASYLHLTTDR